MLANRAADRAVCAEQPRAGREPQQPPERRANIGIRRQLVDFRGGRIVICTRALRHLRRTVSPKAEQVSADFDFHDTPSFIGKETARAAARGSARLQMRLGVLATEPEHQILDCLAAARNQTLPLPW